MRPKRPRGLACAACAALALLSFASCATRPSAVPSSAEAREAKPSAAPPARPVVPNSKPAAPSPKPAAIAKAESPAAGGRAAAKRGYLETALSDYWSGALPNGARLAIKRQSGRKLAAMRVILSADEPAGGDSEAGYAELAFRAATRAAAGGEGGELLRAAAASGASVAYELEGSGGVALAISCPTESAEPLADLVARALASPAFAEDDFASALREARGEERRRSGDPGLLAAVRVREHSDGDSSATPPWGTEASLSAATRDNVMRYWSGFFGAGRLTVVLVGDFEPGLLAARLEVAFAAIPGSPIAAMAKRPAAIEPSFEALPLSSASGYAFLRGEYDAPDPTSPDHAAMAVALAMLDDLLAPGASARLSDSSTPRASVVVRAASDPAAAKAAVNEAINEISEGYCADLGSSTARAAQARSLSPLARWLEAYKLRAIESEYARMESTGALAARIAKDLAAGGDGTAVFRLASGIAAVKEQDLIRVSRRYLRDGSSAWIALGDPEFVGRIDPSAFLARR